MKYAVIIPARYQSTRLPGKPLIKFNGKSMINRVWDRCIEAVDTDKVYIATDNKIVFDHVKTFTKNVLMTSVSCLTGTDRVFQAAEMIGGLDFVINVQGDEPLINPDDIRYILKSSFDMPNTLINGFSEIRSELEFQSRSIPKVVASPDGKLLYMSRSPIPGSKEDVFLKAFKQVCIYSFPLDVLREFCSLKNKTPLESIEDIEILRFLELGYSVQMLPMVGSNIAVDTEEDKNIVNSIILNKEVGFNAAES